MKQKYRIFCFLAFSFCCMRGQTGGEESTNIDYNNVNMPESPSAAAFTAMGNTSVDMATGVPHISIPLYTLEMDGLSIPISLSYNAAGVKVGDLATPVGLNWTLNAGGTISRTVRAKSDEYEGWFDPDYSFLSDDWYDSYDNNPSYWQDIMRGNLENNFTDAKARRHDHQPDQFSYSFNGHSGNFIFTPQGHMIKEKNDGVTIDNWDSPGDTFDASDLNGNSYEFGHTEQSRNTNTYGIGGDVAIEFFDWEGEDDDFPITAWKLSKITTKNGKSLNFEYISEDITPYILQRTESNVTIGSNCIDQSPPDPASASFSYTNITYDFNTQLIKKIWTGDGNIEITFDYATDNSLSHWKTKLVKITVKDSLLNNFKEFHLVYDKFGGDPRSKLTEVYEKGANNVRKPSYLFTYNGNYMPAKDSKGQDLYGYYNGKEDNHSLVDMMGATHQGFEGFINLNTGDRSLVETALKNGILTKIEYPTGGSTEFTYEANSLNGKYLGGLRVSNIKDKEGSVTVGHKSYQYEDLHGDEITLSVLRKLEGASWSYYSSVIATPGELNRYYRPGYYYGKVTMTSINGTDEFKEEHIFEDNTNALHKWDYALKVQKYYKGNAVVKIKEYSNAKIGEGETLIWNILGDRMCDGYSWSSGFLGYNNMPVKVFHFGNYALLPTQVATTEFFGSNYDKPVTTVQYIAYDLETLLKTQEITDTQLTRNGSFSYVQDHPDGEKITVDYTYPYFEEYDNEPSLQGLPKALPVSKIVSSANHGGIISGQFFEYDANGNIKTTFQYNKGEGTNTSPLSYIPDDYEQMSSFLFANGKPVEVLDLHGIATSYIWGYNGQYPVAKVEGKSRSALPQSLVTQIEAASPTALPGLLEQLRNHTTLTGAMVTTFTHIPLYGVSTITDPKGDTATFHYDAFGRLMKVTDEQDKIRSENEYHYGE